MSVWNCFLFFFIRSGWIRSQVSLNVLIINKSMIILYIDVVYVLSR